MTSTHDLPTVAGWWRGADLAWRRQLGMAQEDEIARRPAERAALWRAFEEAGVAREPMPGAADSERAIDAAMSCRRRGAGATQLAAARGRDGLPLSSRTCRVRSTAIQTGAAASASLRASCSARRQSAAGCARVNERRK
jgi:4-alpha-glucanotransferase